MTPQQLLIPRYEVIAPWPNGGISVGTILIESLPNYYRHSTKTGISYRVQNIDQYPHLFQPLQWWEKRNIEEMPEYLSHTLPNEKTTYHKIIRWDMDLLVGYENEKNVCNLRAWKDKYNYQPALESDYITPL